ncbi:MAG: hypothetical protein WCW52_00335 [Elusimicrobiales bacterium]|jgi:hypothetical protein
MGIWDNAFKLPGHRELTEEEKELLRDLALKVNKRSMGTAASLALESTRPLHNLGSQALVFLLPLLNAFFSREKVERFVGLLENPKAAAFFIEELRAGEEHAEQRKL